MKYYLLRDDGDGGELREYQSLGEVKNYIEENDESGTYWRLIRGEEIDMTITVRKTSVEFKNRGETT